MQQAAFRDHGQAALRPEIRWIQGADYKIDLLDSQGQPTEVARVIFPESARAVYGVRAFSGSGGFIVEVTAHDSGLRYILLPGARFQSKGLEITVNGDTPTDLAAIKTQARAFTPQNYVKTAYVLAGGKGSRLSAFTNPEDMRWMKQALDLVGIPIIRRLVDTLQSQGIETFYLAANDTSKPNKVALNGVPGTFFIEDNTEGHDGIQHGVCYSLKRLVNQELGAIVWDEKAPVLYVNGETVSNVDIGKVVKAHQASNAAITLIGRSVAPPKTEPHKPRWRFDLIDLPQQSDDPHVKKIVNLKVCSIPPNQKIFEMKGMMLLSPEALQVIPEIYQQALKNAEPSQINADGTLHEFDNGRHVIAEVIQRCKDNKLVNAAGKPMQVVAYEIPETTFMDELDYSYEALINGSRQLVTGKIPGLALPDNLSEVYDERTGVFYWPGTREVSVNQDQAVIGGNVIVAKPFATTG